MTTEIGQRGGGRVSRLGHGPHDDIAVGDNAADLLVFDDDHIANICIPHGAGRLMHGRSAGQRHGVGGHQLTHLLRHALLLLLGPRSRTPGCKGAVWRVRTRSAAAVPTLGGTGPSLHPRIGNNTVGGLSHTTLASRTWGSPSAAALWPHVIERVEVHTVQKRPSKGLFSLSDKQGLSAKGS